MKQRPRIYCSSEQKNLMWYRGKTPMARDELTRKVYTFSARSTLQPVIEELLREIEAERESQLQSD